MHAEFSCVDTGQHDFPGSCPNSFPGGFHCFGNGSAAAVSACQGNGAVRAIVIATVLHFEEVAGAVVERNGWFEIFHFQNITPHNFTLCFGMIVAQVILNGKFFIGSEHQIHSFDGGNFFRFELGIAARYYHFGVGMLAVKPADGLTAFVVGGIGYGTGVDNADICLLTVADFGKSLFLQLLSDGRSLRKV